MPGCALYEKQQKVLYCGKKHVETTNLKQNWIFGTSKKIYKIDSGYYIEPEWQICRKISHSDPSRVILSRNSKHFSHVPPISQLCNDPLSLVFGWFDISQIWQFQCLTLEIHGQSHRQVQVPRLYVKQIDKFIHTVFVSCKSNHVFLRHRHLSFDLGISRSRWLPNSRKICQLIKLPCWR